MNRSNASNQAQPKLHLAVAVPANPVRIAVFSLMVSLASGLTLAAGADMGAGASTTPVTPAEFSQQLQAQLDLDEATRDEIRDTLAHADTTPALNRARTRAALALVLSTEQLVQLRLVDAAPVSNAALPTLASNAGR